MRGTGLEKQKEEGGRGPNRTRRQSGHGGGALIGGAWGLEMAHRLLQFNANHSRTAQDLLLQMMAKRECELVIVAEPHRVPTNNPSWVGDASGTVAVMWRWWKGAWTVRPLEKGDHFVIVKWEPIVAVGVYFPPSSTLPQFEGWLDSIGACLARLQPPLALVAGDFNAWCTD